MKHIPNLKTNEEYKSELNELFPNIELIGDYKGNSQKTDYKCKICGHEWSISPKLLKRTKYGCPNCAEIKKHSMYSEAFYSKMKTIHPDIMILGEYIDSKTKIKLKCLIDGYEWYSDPAHLIHRKHGCPKCGGSLKLTNDEFLHRLKIEHPNLVALTEYINDSTKVKMHCNICNNEWYASPSHLHQGRGCPECAIQSKHDKFAKSIDQFIEEMKLVDPTIIITGNYVNGRTPIECKCSVCGSIWYPTPSNLLAGKGCSVCASSKGEKRVAHYLRLLNINYEPEYRFDDCRYKYPLPFDFYIPSLNTCIEFDGQQHYFPVMFGNQSYDDAESAFLLNKTKDKIKTDYCKSKNINLIRIPYWEYDNIDKILEKHVS